MTWSHIIIDGKQSHGNLENTALKLSGQIGTKPNGIINAVVKTQDINSGRKPMYSEFDNEHDAINWIKDVV
ncbi:MAG: hypothetical protein KAJ03_10230 [Gammaproteobacteria bacterium]|nr:hypothetical protein [Gammaproteobacteria bacterium]